MKKELWGYDALGNIQRVRDGLSAYVAWANDGEWGSNLFRHIREYVRAGQPDGLEFFVNDRDGFLHSKVGA